MDANTKKVVGIVLIVLGAVLLYFGLQATDAPLEQAVPRVRRALAPKR